MWISESRIYFYVVVLYKDFVLIFFASCVTPKVITESNITVYNKDGTLFLALNINSLYFFKDSNVAYRLSLSLNDFIL